MATQVSCSFCGRDKTDVDLMISGINAHICNNCITQSYQILEEENKVQKKDSIPEFNLIKPKEIKNSAVWG